MTAPQSLLLVGCGKMGHALLERWKLNSAISQFYIIEPNHARISDGNVSWHPSLDSLAAEIIPDIVVFAIKPQQLDNALPTYRARFSPHTPLYISIAAGKTIAYYAAHLGENAHIVRAMPNTPALVGEGMTVLAGTSTLPASQQKIAMDLMQAVGKTEWLADEALMDAVTAISGCGPAYVFLFIESLVKAGMQAGLPEALAKTLTLQTIAGSLQLAQHSGKSFEQMRIDVASPGGATEAALRVLMQEKSIKFLLEDAVQAAAMRAKELSS